MTDEIIKRMNEGKMMNIKELRKKIEDHYSRAVNPKDYNSDFLFYTFECQDLFRILDYTIALEDFFKQAKKYNQFGDISELLSIGIDEKIEEIDSLRIKNKIK